MQEVHTPSTAVGGLHRMLACEGCRECRAGRRLAPVSLQQLPHRCLQPGPAIKPLLAASCAGRVLRGHEGEASALTGN